MVDVLLAAHADPNLPDLSGVTPLMSASYGSNPALVHKLLAAGARIDSIDRVKKNAATYAAGQGCAACLQELLNAGAQVNARLENDLTLLMWAAGYGRDEVAKLLLERGADRSLRDNRGKTAADIARELHFASLAQLLQP
jgi:ankyrin repeat protein